MPPMDFGFVQVPDYSADLNLCARVEAKIAEMGEETQRLYARLLTRAVIDARYGDRQWYKDSPEDSKNAFTLEPFDIATAPAAARVDAMVALCQSALCL
jgi:hypothetical protein